MVKKYFLMTLFSLLLFFIVGASTNVKQDEGPMITSKGKTAYGYVVLAGGTSKFGISSFDMTNPAILTNLYIPSYYSSAGAVVDGYMYCDLYKKESFNEVPISFSKIKLSDGTSSVIANSVTTKDLFTDMTYDYNEKKMYYVSMISATQSELGTIDLTDGKTTVIGIIPLYLITLACDKSGQLFSLDNKGNLYRIDKANAMHFFIGSTGEKVQYYQSMDFDRDTDELYWAGYTSSAVGFFAKIDTKTGFSTRIGVFQNKSELTGLYIPFTPIPEAAPSAVTNLTIISGITEADAHSTKITFNTPSITVGGEALIVIDKIEILRDGVLIHTFTSPATGVALTHADNVSLAGTYTYRVIATNVAGDGVCVGKTLFVGEDVPNPATNLTITREGTHAVLNWTEPTSGINNGWINIAKMRYEITRLPDNVVVASGARGNTYTDKTISQDKIGKYSYTIKAVTDVGSSSVITSINSVIFGQPFSVPYTCAFDSKEDFELWTVIDANNDAKTWTRSATKAAQYTYHPTNRGDDWLISPPIALQEGKTYRLMFDAKSSESLASESLKVYYGQGMSIEDQVNQLADYPALDFLYDTKSVVIKAAKTGEYNFGFYAYSKAKSYNLLVTKIVVEEMYDNDLMAVSIKGATLPIVGKEYSYKAMIKNNGMNFQGNYTVQIVNSTESVLCSTVVTDNIASGEIKSIVLKWTPTQAETIDVKCKVLLVGDQQIENNETTVTKINVQEIGNEEWAVIGNGVVMDSNIPISLYFQASASQSIYKEEEIGFGGVIQRVVYQYNNTSGKVITKPIKLYMSSTTLKDLSGGLIPEEKLTLVFDGAITVAKGVGELVINLTIPFVHTGGNLCITAIRPLDTETFKTVKFNSTDMLTEKRSRTYSQSSTDFNWLTDWTTISTKIPNIKILSVTTGGGKMEGVVKSNGMPIGDAYIQLSPTITVKSNENGFYAFNYLPAGTYTVTVTKHGFHDKIAEGVVVISDQTKIVDVNLIEMPKYTLSGSVKDADGRNVENADVVINGYDNYKLTTDAEGNFTISNVYKSNTYSIKVTKESFMPISETFDIVDEDIQLSITLTDMPYMPIYVKAVSSEEKVNITWNEPSKPELFRYDDNNISRQIGYQQGTANSLFGSVHRSPSVLNNMSWWTVGAAAAGGPHNTVNVFVMDIDSDGNPTSTVLFKQMNVPNKDDKWSTFYFPEPIECPRGCMIAISYTGFVGIAIDSGQSAEYPFVENAHYSTFDYTTGKYNVMLNSGPDAMPYNILIRAEHHKLNDVAKSMKGYRVWRFLENDKEHEANWTQITTSDITTTSYSDNNWISATAGAYKYAVKAIYSGNVISKAYISNVVLRELGATVTINLATNIPSGDAQGAIVTLTNNNNPNLIYKQTVTESGTVIISDVWKGIYKIKIELAGYTIIEDINIDFSINNTYIKEYQLKEIVELPYNLQISDASVSTERTFSWSILNNKTLKNYEVYLDNEKQADVITPTYIFKNLATGKHTAGVKAIYGSAVTDMVTIDFEVEEGIYKPERVTAVEDGDNVNITWIEGCPKTAKTFRYDDGKITSSVGSNGTDKTVAGTIYRTPATITSMSWMTMAEEVTKVNVFVFDLNERGFPTQTILYTKANVDNISNELSSLTFEKPVECPRGFCLAISISMPTTGNVTLGVDTGVSTQYPFVPDVSVISVDYTSGKFVYVGSIASKNFIIRAEGLVDEESKTATSYKVWRLNITDETDESKWTPLTTIAQTELSFIDNSWSSITAGLYKYAIKTIYSGGRVSDAGFSNTIEKAPKYAVNYDIPENGTLMVKDGTTDVLSGSMIRDGVILTVTAIPNEDYEIDTLTANGVEIENNSVSITQTTKIVATFKKPNAITSPNSTLNLNIYPNPVKDILNIDGEYTSIEMYNILGERVMSANGESKINVHTLPDGLYIIKARNNDQIGIYKILK